MHVNVIIDKMAGKFRFVKLNSRRCNVEQNIINQITPILELHSSNKWT